MSESSVLTLETETRGDSVIVRCGGKLTSDVSRQLHAEVKPLFASVRMVTLDLTDLTYMDSMGLGTIASLYVSAKTSGCRFELINLSRRIRDLFTVTHLLSLFEACGEQNITIP